MKFSLRNVIFATLVLGIVFAWIADRNRMRKNIDELEKSNTHLRELIEIRAPGLLDAVDYKDFE